MAFNGDGPHIKRQRTDVDAGNNRGHTGNYGNVDEPRRKRQEDTKPNHVLLFTIINPMYPITVDVLHTICQASGQVLRIVIFKKNGVQAMVEFDSVDSAVRAKDTLNGADIYSGCCTLKIDFAKPDKLNVHKNDSESWDYTISMVKENTNGRPQPLLQEPHYGSRPQPFNPYPAEQPRYDDICGGGGGGTAGHGGYGDTFPSAEGGFRKSGSGGSSGGGGGVGGGGGGGGGGGVNPVSAAAAAAGDYREQGLPPQQQQQQQQQLQQSQQQQQQRTFQHPGAVLMVYGLDPLRTNADKLFNLMCLYGNVARIKFLKSKEGTAMVQMGDGVAVERCVQNLNNVSVGLTGAAPLINHSTGGSSAGSNSNSQTSANATGSTDGSEDNTPTTGNQQQNAAQAQSHHHNSSDHKLQLAFSKQPYLSEVTNPYPLPDKSPSFKEYITNKNNRFISPAMASKNRIQPPSKILHFFNTPPQVSEEELVQVFNDYDVVAPKAVKLFPMKSERSSSGLLEFESTTEAVAAVMACNHAAIDSPGTKFPFIMKLCFSSSRSMSIRNGENNANGAPQDRRIDQEGI